MPFQIIRNDITKLECDAIVNAANSSLLGGGGVDGAIHKAAGKRLLLECMTLGGCKTGQAKMTKGYKLPAKYVIHTVGPVWHGGKNNEEELLRSCYRQSLKIAAENEFESIAFPLISSGVYGYPKHEALRVAIEEITAFLLENEMLVYLVVFDKSALEISEKLFSDVSAYIDDNYADENCVIGNRMMPQMSMPSSALEPGYSKPRRKKSESIESAPSEMVCDEICESVNYCAAPSLEEMMSQIDESFSDMLLRKIDEKNMKDADCYKKANIDRKLFSKIRSDRLYKPSKRTVLAFAIALELPLYETRDMLMKAGFALSHSSKGDIIIEYFINNGIYDIITINETLFAFDQPLLGS